MAYTILLVDDHTILREGLNILFREDPDFTVVGEAGNGLEAVREAERLRPDVVILGVALPLLGGIEAARRILEGNNRIKIVILSMYASKEHIYLALKAGARAYLPKECSFSELLEGVRKVVKNKIYISPSISRTLLDDVISRKVLPPAVSPLEQLSPKERELLPLLSEGKKRETIAELFNLSPKTVDTYKSRILRKLDLKNSHALVRFALYHGIIK